MKQKFTAWLLVLALVSAIAVSAVATETTEQTPSETTTTVTPETATEPAAEAAGDVAADSADILITCALVLFSLFSGRGVYLDVAIISAMLGILDTMLVGRYLEGRL